MIVEKKYKSNCIKVSNANEFTETSSDDPIALVFVAICSRSLLTFITKSVERTPLSLLTSDIGFGLTIGGQPSLPMDAEIGFGSGTGSFGFLSARSFSTLSQLSSKDVTSGCSPITFLFFSSANFR
jgi:hypothetical protein